MKLSTLFFVAFLLFAVAVSTSDALNKRNDKKTTTTTTPPTTTTTTTQPTITTTRLIISDCPNPYVNKCGVTCCQGRQHCCVNDPTRCCNPIISQ